LKLGRYLAGDVLGHTLAVSFVLLAIIITGRFVKYLAEAASGKLAAEVLLPVMFYRLPGFLELLLPLGLFIGILMAYGRLYVESEMVVISACGVGPGQLLRFTMIPALLVAALVAALSLYVTPQGAARSEALLSDPQTLQGLQLLGAGRFQPRGRDGAVSYAGGVDADAGELRQVFLFDPGAGDADSHPSVTLAKQGNVVRNAQTGIRYLELGDGYRFIGSPGRGDFQVIRFSAFGERLPEDSAVVKSQPVDARSTAFLLQSPTAEDRAALHWRLSLFVMVPIVAMLALSLSKTNNRRGRYIKLAPALLLHLSYLMLLASTRTRIAEGEAPPQFLWIIHGGFLLLALLLLFGPQHLNRWRRA
jgi:lipopolysaccharide export system permease protein